MARSHLTLLGNFQLRLSNKHAVRLPTKKAEALICYLALHRGQAISRNCVASLLWGEEGRQAQDSLRHTIAAIKKALPKTRPPILLIEGHTLTLNHNAIDVDVANFERLALMNLPTIWGQAAEHYQGNLLAGFSLQGTAYELWLVFERERLRDLAVAMLNKLLVHQSKHVTAQAAIRTAMRILALDPLNEGVHRNLMRLYIHQRRRRDALKQYDICADALRRELGVEPEPETNELYRHIRFNGTRVTKRNEVVPENASLPANAVTLTLSDTDFAKAKTEASKLQMPYSAYLTQLIRKALLVFTGCCLNGALNPDFVMLVCGY
jgi:DNA-binding SARP family transcriptional activator